MRSEVFEMFQSEVLNVLNDIIQVAPKALLTIQCIYLEWECTFPPHPLCNKNVNPSKLSSLYGTINILIYILFLLLYCCDVREDNTNTAN